MAREGNVHITNDLKNPTQEGIYHRLLCMTGPRKGTVVYLSGKRILLGRGDKVDIQINDVKISREHAEFTLVDNHYTVTDLNTQNGIIVNDTKEKQKVLEDGMKIVIGQTVLKYNYIVIEAGLVPVSDKGKSSEEKGNKKSKLTIKRPDDFDVEEPTPEPKSKKNGLVLVVVIVVVLYVLMGGKDETGQVVKDAGKSVNESAEIEDPFTQTESKKNKMEDRETKIKVESLIHRGRREYREGNYFRAMEDFRLALTLEPGNATASFYNSKSKQRLDEEVTKFFSKAKQDKEAKKFQGAMVSYSSILRLLKGYPGDERFINAYCQLFDMLKSGSSNEKYLDADTKIEELHVELGIKKDEVKCNKEQTASKVD